MDVSEDQDEAMDYPPRLYDERASNLDNKNIITMTTWETSI